MTDSQHGRISVIEKNGRVFVGILADANEHGVALLSAREVKNRDAVFVATFGIEESDMRLSVSRAMNHLSIFQIDLCITPNDELQAEIKRLFGIE
jgi:hypothetical protein